MNVIVSTDGTFSFPRETVYGIDTVRILSASGSVAGRTLDTPRHVSIAAVSLGFKIGETVTVVSRDGFCKSVRVDNYGGWMG